MRRDMLVLENTTGAELSRRNLTLIYIKYVGNRDDDVIEAVLEDLDCNEVKQIKLCDVDDVGMADLEIVYPDDEEDE